MLAVPSLQWPVIVKFPDDPELVYASTPDECSRLLADCDDHMRVSALVIDSAGRVQKANDLVSVDVDLTTLTRWIQEHAAALDQCCVAKIHVRNVCDAISFVAQLEELR